MDIIGAERINITELEELKTLSVDRLFEEKLKTFVKGNYLKILNELDSRIASVSEADKNVEKKRKVYLNFLDYFEFILGLEFQLKNNGYEIDDVILNKIFQTYLKNVKNSAYTELFSFLR
jgi:hypothetical protein